MSVVLPVVCFSDHLEHLYADPCRGERRLCPNGIVYEYLVRKNFYPDNIGGFLVSTATASIREIIERENMLDPYNPSIAIFNDELAAVLSVQCIHVASQLEWVVATGYVTAAHEIPEHVLPPDIEDYIFQLQFPFRQHFPRHDTGVYTWGIIRTQIARDLITMRCFNNTWVFLLKPWVTEGFGGVKALAEFQLDTVVFNAIRHLCVNKRSPVLCPYLLPPPKFHRSNVNPGDYLPDNDFVFHDFYDDDEESVSYESAPEPDDDSWSEDSDTSIAFDDEKKTTEHLTTNRCLECNAPKTDEGVYCMSCWDKIRNVNKPPVRKKRKIINGTTTSDRTTCCWICFDESNCQWEFIHGVSACHGVCKNCARKWLQQDNKQCPMCRYTIEKIVKSVR